MRHINYGRKEPFSERQFKSYTTLAYVILCLNIYLNTYYF